ncbi:MAG TPA: hydantoinase/oxoprolinase family protein, partial [Pyrinomonadaceae bacterium]|nr:hydantoinase/oxoprolinase family protein [Pyrinomonadaceae bacterium]
MARAIRAVTVERGVDPRDFTLLAFGGSGPVHACDLATMLGIRRVLFPRAPGVFTAMGMLAGNVEQHFIRAVPGLLHNLEITRLNEAAKALETDAKAALREEGYEPEDIDLRYELDLRFRGQDSELPIPIAPSVTEDDRSILRADFLKAYTALYGYASTDEVEAVNLRLTAKVKGEVLDFTKLTSRQLTTEIAEFDNRPVYFNRAAGWIDTPVLDRSAFSGTRTGPLVLQSTDTTIVVPPGAEVALDSAQNIIVSL